MIKSHKSQNQISFPTFGGSFLKKGQTKKKKKYPTSRLIYKEQTWSLLCSFSLSLQKKADIYICIYIFPSLSCAASKSINQNAQLATSPPPSIPLNPPFPLSLILFLVSLMGSTPYEKKNLLRLRCSVQNYDWGLKGHDSRVARLSAHNSGSEIRPDTPYAEFWMGTHQSGPSFVVHTPRGSNGVSVVKSDNDDVGVSLKSWISDNPNVLGDKVLDKWGCDLPFLFKVINTILLMFFHMRLCL